MRDPGLFYRQFVYPYRPRQILPAGAGTAPTAPSGLGATEPVDNTPQLDWTDNASDETGFKIERKLGAGSYSEVDTVGANVITWDEPSSLADGTYTYRVRATNGAGDSAYSNEAVIVLSTTAPFDPPLSRRTPIGRLVAAM